MHAMQRRHCTPHFILFEGSPGFSDSISIRVVLHMHEGGALRNHTAGVHCKGQESNGACTY